VIEKVFNKQLKRTKYVGDFFAP